MDEKHYIITFNSTHHALTFEKASKENNIKAIIMPVPRNIASSCGLALKFSQEYFVELIRLVKDKELNYADIYRIENIGSKKDYIKMDVKAL